MLSQSRLLILFLAGLIFQSTGLAFEKVGTTSFQFLKVMNDARGTAMGEAYTAVVNNSDAVYYNPGALTDISGNYDFSASHTKWFMDSKHFAFSMAHKTRRWGTLGLMGLIVDMGYIEETRVSHLGFDSEMNYNPGLTGEKLYIGAFGLGVAYAKNLTNKFSFGGVMKFVKEDLHYGDASSIIFDIGMLYRTGYRSINISTVVRNFGPEVAFTQVRDTTLVPYSPDDSSDTITGEGYPLPQTFNIGISAYLIGKGESLMVSNMNHSLLVSFDLIHPRDYDQQYGFGLEYGFHDILFVRSGYKLNYDEEGLCFGMGFKVGSYRLDYSYNDYGEFLGAVNRFSIGILIP